MKATAYRLKDVQRIGLIAGEGALPLHVARTAARRGIEVVPFTLSGKNTRELRGICKQPGYAIVPGLIEKTQSFIEAEGLHHLVFAGKVDKWVLLRDPRLDASAIAAMKQLVRLNDDAIMLWLVDELEKRGIAVLQQTDFLEDLFLGESTLTRRHPDDTDWKDIAYGFEMARELGRLDIGQTVVVRQGMVLAVEAIEGTDKCLRRAGELAAKKGGVVIKVAKPDQDQRFDVPTVGLRTLKTMKRHGLHCLAAEAGATLFLEPDEMTAFADKHNMSIIVVSPHANQATHSAVAVPKASDLTNRVELDAHKQASDALRLSGRGPG